MQNKSGLKRHSNEKHEHETESSGDISEDRLTTDLLLQIVSETSLQLSKNKLASYSMVLGKYTHEMKMM